MNETPMPDDVMDLEPGDRVTLRAGLRTRRYAVIGDHQDHAQETRLDDLRAVLDDGWQITRFERPRPTGEGSSVDERLRRKITNMENIIASLNEELERLGGALPTCACSLAYGTVVTLSRGVQGGPGWEEQTVEITPDAVITDGGYGDGDGLVTREYVTQAALSRGFTITHVEPAKNDDEQEGY